MAKNSQETLQISPGPARCNAPVAAAHRLAVVDPRSAQPVISELEAVLSGRPRSIDLATHRHRVAKETTLLPAFAVLTGGSHLEGRFGDRGR
ncbi:hypothetical protein GCM10022255_108750 [Dactylosporangium darangshiense]|uniref:Uncharacterized protein n=1 Tax=Dactylosporangium darangshiense TaxID=579108 RepID=A0ABP8DUX4_9ACTN